MRRGFVAVGLPVVCLLLGLGVGYLLFSGEGASRDGDASDLSAEDAPAPARGSTAEPLRTAALQGRGHADPLVAVFEAVPVPETERGEGIIQGRVTDASGEAVAGVRMTLNAVGDAGAYPRRDPTDDPDVALLKSLRATMEQHRWGSAFRQVTTTDADGRYRFESVTKRKHRVEALRDGYQIYPRDHTTWQGAFPDATIDFQATPMARLRIEIVGSAAPTSLQVELRTANGSSTGQQWSASNPVLDFQPGTWDVHVSGGDQQELRAGPYPVVLVAGGEPQTLRVELEARPVLRLHLKFAPDEVMSLYTYIMPAPPGGMPSPAVLRARGKTDMRRWMHDGMLSGTSAEHVQTYNDLEEGTYVVGIARDRSDGAIVHMEEVVLRGGLVDHTIEVPPLEPDSYVIVAAYGPDGVLLKQAGFSTGVRSETGSSSGRSQTALRRDGRTLVMHQDGGGPPEAGATWWVDVTAPNLGRKRVEYVRGQVRELRVDFQEPAEVSVEVKGVRGTPYEGRVSVVLHPGGSKQRGGVASGRQAAKNGLLVVRGVQPGEYIVALHVQSGEHRTSEVAEMPCTLKPGAQTLSLSLPPLYALTVRGATRHVSLRSADRTSSRLSLSQTADADGVAVFDALPAGAYKVNSRGASADVTLPGPSEITLTSRSR